MTPILNIIGVVTSLSMIGVGVWLSVTKNPFWFLMLLVLLVLWVCVSLCRAVLLSVSVTSASQNTRADDKRR